MYIIIYIYIYNEKQNLMITEAIRSLHVPLITNSTCSPGTQPLISGPRSCPLGQAQVYLGECSVICGALRHKYSQPPLATLPRLQLSGPADGDAENERDMEDKWHSYASTILSLIQREETAERQREARFSALREVDLYSKTHSPKKSSVYRTSR